MAPDNETIPHAVEVQEDVENINIGKECKVENLTEKTEDKNVGEKKEIAEAVAEIIEKNVDEVVVNESVAAVAETKQHEPNVTDETKENDPIVSEKQPVPSDEIAMKKEAEIKEKNEEKSKEECVIETFVPLKIEESAMDIKRDDPAVDNNGKQHTVEALETKENKETDETSTKLTDPEKPAVENLKTESKEEKPVENLKPESKEEKSVENLKTESKEEKPVDERKSTDSKEEEKTSPKQANTLMGKVRKSFMKARKAVTWKNNSNTKNPDTKEDEKA